MARNQTDYKNLGHSLIENHLKTVADKKMPKIRVSKSRLNKITDFITTTLSPWLGYYLKNRFGRKADYPVYQAPHDGIYHFPSEEETVIAIAGDWATDTRESHEVAHKMGKHYPHYTIHMGDVYFVGDGEEIRRNFLDPGNPWVKGSHGSFALLGNHEMYARGISYFKDLLPSLGIQNSSGHFEGQQASFFCLENEYWRVLGLDTGYHSIGVIPILEMLNMFTPNARLHDKAVQWLHDIIQPGNPDDHRGLIILTHHPCVTAFLNQIEFKKPAEQLSNLLPKEKSVVWLCGHEHKFAMYSKMKVADKLNAHVRCIGNGGMPVELHTRGFKPDIYKKSYDHLFMLDNREDESNQNKFGFNGYTLLKFRDRNLFIEYYDKNNLLLTEQWTNGEGILSGTIVYHHKDLKLVGTKNWDDATK